jgi:LPXTG-motif cell wall-anchored protein
MEQTQEADIQSEITDTEMNKAEAGVNVKTRNSLEFIKETSANAVKLVQEIFVNNILVDVFNRDYSLNENHSYVPLNQQTYQKQFDWGNLFVSNEAVFSFNEEWQNFEGTLTSTLSLILNGSIFGERTTDNPDQNNDNGSEPSDPVVTDHPSHETNDGNNIEIPATPVTAETSQVSKQEVTAVPTATANDQSQPVSSKPNVIENGKELPNTSTNNFNVLLLGILLLAAGIGILFSRKMKQN